MLAARYLQTCLFLTRLPFHTGVECEVAYESTLWGASWSKESHMWTQTHILGRKTTELLVAPTRRTNVSKSSMHRALSFLHIKKSTFILAKTSTNKQLSDELDWRRSVLNAARLFFRGAVRSCHGAIANSKRVHSLIGAWGGWRN